MRSIDPHLERVLEHALLPRRELVVADHHLGVDWCDERLQLLELARAEVRARMRTETVLHDAARRRPPAVRSSSSISSSSASPSNPDGQTAMTTARSGSASRMMWKESPKSCEAYRERISRSQASASRSSGWVSASRTNPSPARP